MAHADQLLEINPNQLPLWLLCLALGPHPYSRKTSQIPAPSGKF